MIDQDIRDELPEDAIVFDNPAFDNSIIGYDINGCAVYDYNEMVREMMKDDGVSEEDAIDFIECNTIVVLPYIEENRPIIIYKLENR